MVKDFDGWNFKKKNIDDLKRPFFHEREIWSCHIGVNVGFEQDGKGGDFLRPVIIIRKFNDKIFWGVPLTRSLKTLNENTRRYYFDFVFEKGVQSRVILSQIRLIDARRLSYLVGRVLEKDFLCLKEKLRTLMT